MTGNATPFKATILIVDDEPYNVDYLQQSLSDLGFRTREAYGGREALDVVAENPPDLILLDVMMPDMDGITVCRVLKGDPATQLIPIVIMTALDGKEDRIRGIEAGADDFLTKPVDDRELLARINTVLRTKHVVDETIEELASATEQLESLGPRREEVALLAVELRPGVTSGSDSIGPAHDYLLARYHRVVTEVVERFDGQLVESPEDWVYAVMRSPAGGADPLRALEAARAIQAEVHSLNRHNDVLPIDAAIAVNLGEVSIAQHRVEKDGAMHWVQSVTGAVSNQTLQMMSEAGRGDILAGSAVIARVPGRFGTEPVEPANHALGTAAPYRVLEEAPDTEEPQLAPSVNADDAQVRVLATILVSDLVGSTAIAARLGDRAWTEALDGHYRLVRDTFAQHDGEEISTAGDGFLALFDRPAKAIRAGLTIAEQSASSGLPVRVGVHTGELERSDHDVRGIAVHLAARISAQAGAGDVLVSATTKEAVAGSGLLFRDAGERSLKGIEGPRRVYLALTD